MKILGIIAEYNPLHNGHIYQIKKAKELTGADYTVICMSGNFVQRGEPAILDKWTRSRLVLDCDPSEQGNADLVFELPFVYACNRAHYFAKGAVNMLAGVGVTHISFGCETDDFQGLIDLASGMRENADELSEMRIRHMEDGASFAKATELAIRELFGPEAAELVQGPNNILSIEYLKCIQELEEQGIHIEPVPVQRYVSGINEANSALGFAGSTEIRRLISENYFDETVKYMPGRVCLALSEGVNPVVGIRSSNEKLFELVRYNILMRLPEELAEIYCVGEGLENKMKKEIAHVNSPEQLIEALTSRRYPAAAIKRMLIYVLLGLTGKTADFLTGITEEGDEKSPVLYARVLAAGLKGQELLRLIKDEGLNSIPVLTNINKEINEDDNPEMSLLLAVDSVATDMYNALYGRNIYDYSDKVVTPYMEK